MDLDTYVMNKTPNHNCYESSFIFARWWQCRFGLMNNMRFIYESIYETHTVPADALILNDT